MKDENTVPDVKNLFKQVMEQPERMFDMLQIDIKHQAERAIKELLKAERERINARIEALLDGDHVIGHAWLLDVSDINALRAAFRHRIMPLLQEFFFDDLPALAKVLRSIYPESILVSLSDEDLGWTGETQGTRYKINYPVLSVPEFYKGIYEG